MNNFYKMTPQLGFGEAVKLASGRLVDFKGRSRRSEFWWWMMIVLVCNFVASLLLPSYTVANAVALTLIMACGLSVTVRRLHDTGQSGIWVYISFALGIATQFFSVYALADFFTEYMEMLEFGTVPNPDDITELMTPYIGRFLGYMGLTLLWGVSSLVVFIMVLMDGKAEPNKYGPSPKYVPEA